MGNNPVYLCSTPFEYYYLPKHICDSITEYLKDNSVFNLSRPPKNVTISHDSVKRIAKVLGDKRVIQLPDNTFALFEKQSNGEAIITKIPMPVKFMPLKD